MSDDVDVANDMAEKMLRMAIEAARGVVVDINGNGECLYCCEEVLEREGLISRFCNKDCADLWYKSR